MNKYELYDRVLSAINEDEGTFNAAARNWVEGAEASNFNNETANELFAKAKQSCAAWRGGAINARISKRRMVDYVRQIVEMNLPNPYDPNEKDPDEEIVEPVIEEPAKEEGKKHIFGVVDAENIQPGKLKKEEIKEEQKEEKSLFKRHKKQQE